jgi:hypothetical protein
LLARRIVVVVDPLSRTAVMLTPRTSCALFGRARAGGALTGSHLPLTFPDDQAFAWSCPPQAPPLSGSLASCFRRLRIPGRQLPTDTLGGVPADSPSEQETRPTTAGLGPWGSCLETSDVVPEPECISALRRAREQLWRVVRCSHAPFAPASTGESSSKAHLFPPSLDHPALPDRSRTWRDDRETCSADVSNPHRLIFSKTSTHVSDRYPRLLANDVDGSRRPHR